MEVIRTWELVVIFCTIVAVPTAMAFLSIYYPNAFWVHVVVYGAIGVLAFAVVGLSVVPRYYRKRRGKDNLERLDKNLAAVFQRFFERLKPERDPHVGPLSNLERFRYRDLTLYMRAQGLIENLHQAVANLCTEYQGLAQQLPSPTSQRVDRVIAKATALDSLAEELTNEEMYAARVILWTELPQTQRSWLNQVDKAPNPDFPLERLFCDVEAEYPPPEGWSEKASYLRLFFLSLTNLRRYIRHGYEQLAKVAPPGYVNKSQIPEVVEPGEVKVGDLVLEANVTYHGRVIQLAEVVVSKQLAHQLSQMRGKRVTFVDGWKSGQYEALIHDVDVREAGEYAQMTIQLEVEQSKS